MWKVLSFKGGYLSYSIKFAMNEGFRWNLAKNISASLTETRGLLEQHKEISEKTPTQNKNIFCRRRTIIVGHMSSSISFMALVLWFKCFFQTYVYILWRFFKSPFDMEINSPHDNKLKRFFWVK